MKNNFLFTIKEHFLNSWKKYLFNTLFVIATLILYIISNGSWTILFSYVDGLFIGGFCVLCFGFLSILNYHGSFDIFSYVFSKRKEGQKNFYDYSESKKVKRKNNKFAFIPYFVISGISLLVTTILYLIVIL